MILDLIPFSSPSDGYTTQEEGSEPYETYFSGSWTHPPARLSRDSSGSTHSVRSFSWPLPHVTPPHLLDNLPTSDLNTTGSLTRNWDILSHISPGPSMAIRELLDDAPTIPPNDLLFNGGTSLLPIYDSNQTDSLLTPTSEGTAIPADNPSHPSSMDSRQYLD